MATLIPRAPLPRNQVGVGPQVRDNTRVDLSANEDMLRTVSGAAQDFLSKQIEKNDITAVMAARRQLSDWETNAFNPGNPDGISKYRGKEALNASGALLPDLDKAIGNIESTLTPNQRARFQQVALATRDSVAGRLNTHMDREHTQYLNSEQEASINSLAEDAVSAGLSGDFGRQDALANEALVMNRARLSSQGFTPDTETARAAERTLASKMRANTVKGLLQTQPLEAAAYFDRYAEQMTPQDRMATQAILSPVVNDVEWDATADAIMAGGAPVAGGDVVESITQLESGGDDKAKATGSSATGAGQFVRGTWLDLMRRYRPDLTKGKSEDEILALRTDGVLSREMVANYASENGRKLSARGLPLSAENLYAAHHFGPEGGVRFASAAPATPVSSVLSREQIAANPYLKGKTVGEVRQNWARRGLRAQAASDGANPSGPPRTEAEAIAYASETIANPIEREGVIRKIREKWTIRDKLRQDQEKALTAGIYTSVSANPNAPLRETMGPEAYAFATRKGWIPELESYRRKMIAGTLVQDDLLLVDALQREAALSPATFMKRNLHEPGVVANLSTDTLQELLNKQKQAKNPANQADWYSESERINSGLRVLGLEAEADPSQKDQRKVRAQQRAAFGVLYREAERAFTQRQGRKPTPEEADKLLRNVTRQVAEDPEAKLRRAGALSGFGAAVSPTEREEARQDFLQTWGREPTEAELVRTIAGANIQSRGR